MVWEQHCLEDIFTKDEQLNESVSDEGVCKTAQATPGLLDIIGIPLLYTCLCFFWIGATTRKHREFQCLPNAGFFTRQSLFWYRYRANSFKQYSTVQYS